MYSVFTTRLRERKKPEQLEENSSTKYKAYRMFAVLNDKYRKDGNSVNTLLFESFDVKSQSRVESNRKKCPMHVRVHVDIWNCTWHAYGAGETNSFTDLVSRV